MENEGILKNLGVFACARKASNNFVLSVGLSACISAAATGRISVKFNTGGLYVHLVTKPKIG
jgi:hypothetical protein